MFVPSVRAVETEIDTIDDLVAHPVAASSGTSRPSQTELLGRIATARKRVTQLIRLMSAKSELLRVIAKRCVMRFTEDAHLYLRDLQDHTAMVDQTLHHYDESLNRSHANYLAHINIEISETSNHMSDVMKKLTAAATVTLPWSMITGLMGMNIFVPGGKSYFTESWVPWLCLFILMSTLSIIIYFVGRRRDWF
jgi:magnesium transporter